MNNHKYSKWNSKGYANKRGWIIGNISFYSLYEAEQYCTVYDLDPNQAIQYAPAIAKSYAAILVNEYEYLLSVVANKLEKQKNTIALLRDKADIRGTKNILEQAKAEVARDYLNNAVGNYLGRLELRNIIENRKINLDGLVRMRIE